MTGKNYSDISAKGATKLLGSEIGSQFDIRERMFSYYGLTHRRRHSLRLLFVVRSGHENRDPERRTDGCPRGSNYSPYQAMSVGYYPGQG
jgi:hypothetical protein